mgnify:CR=1 FL=1
MVSKKQVEKMSRKLYNNRDKKELYFMTLAVEQAQSQWRRQDFLTISVFLP